MRRQDKYVNMEKANILAEQRYLKSKGLLNESDDIPSAEERWAAQEDPYSGYFDNPSIYDKYNPTKETENKNQYQDNMGETEDPLENSARIALNRLGYSYSVLPHYSRQDLIDTLKKESKARFGKEELDDLAHQLESSL